MNTQRIPLFPLRLVVFPGEPVPLHIFEERYRTMIADCEAATQAGAFDEFGITCLNDQDDLADVGCSLRVEEVFERFDDGRLVLMARGMKRFRIVKVVEEKLYREADVEWLDDSGTEDEWDSKLATKVFQMHKLMVELSCGEEVDGEVYSGLESLSWLVGYASGMPPAFKQSVLQMMSENERLAFLDNHLRQVVPQMQVFETIRDEVRQKWRSREGS